MDSKSGVGVNLFYIIQNEYFRMAETKASFVPWTLKFISASSMILCMYGCSFFIASLFLTYLWHTIRFYLNQVKNLSKCWISSTWSTVSFFFGTRHLTELGWTLVNSGMFEMNCGNCDSHDPTHAKFENFICDRWKRNRLNLLSD